METDAESGVWKQVGRYLGLATLLPACVLAGYVLGYALDRSLGTAWIRIAGLILGIVAGFVQLIRELLKEPKA